MRSEHMFFQVEGMAVGHGITMADLKGTLANFAADLRRGAPGALSPELLPVHRAQWRDRYRLHPLWRQGLSGVQELGQAGDLGLRHGAPTCAQRRLRSRRVERLCLWHGAERARMLQNGITDIRLFFGNDLRFLQQFA